MISCLAEVQAGLTESRKGHHGNLALGLMCVCVCGRREGTINALQPDGAGRPACRLVKAVNVLFSAPAESGAAQRTAKDEGIKGDVGEDGRRQGGGGFLGGRGEVWLEDIDSVSTSMKAPAAAFTASPWSSARKKVSCPSLFQLGLSAVTGSRLNR